LENIVIPNYNKYYKLTLTQKIEESLNTCSNFESYLKKIFMVYIVLGKNTYRPHGV